MQIGRYDPSQDPGELLKKMRFPGKPHVDLGLELMLGLHKFGLNAIEADGKSVSYEGVFPGAEAGRYFIFTRDELGIRTEVARIDTTAVMVLEKHESAAAMSVMFESFGIVYTFWATDPHPNMEGAITPA